MTVKELIKLLQKQDPEAEVLSGDNDNWFYDIGGVDSGYVADGREVDQSKVVDGEMPCVLLRP